MSRFPLSPCPSCHGASKYLHFADAQCLPIGLFVGLIFGLSVPGPIMGRTIAQKGVMFYACVVGIFLILGLKLNTAQAKAAMESRKSILYGITSIMALTSLLGIVSCLSPSPSLSPLFPLSRTPCHEGGPRRTAHRRRLHCLSPSLSLSPLFLSQPTSHALPAHK